MNSHPPAAVRSRGSVFIAVVILTAVMALMVASIFGWSLQERHLNMRNTYWLEARTAADALAEYGLAQIENNVMNNPSTITLNPTKPTTVTNIPLVLPPNGFFQPNGDARECHININTVAGGDASGLELIGGYAFSGGVLGGTNTVYIDPKDPSNLYDILNSHDPTKPTSITPLIDFIVVAKATAVPTDGTAPITVFVQETVSQRGGNFASNAIFYSNNDLEIFPGPQMDVYGPVHVNGNLFVSSQSSSLNFHGPVSVTSNVYHAWADVKPAGEGSGGEALGTNPVNFATSTTTTTNMNNAGKWYDSTYNGDSGLFSGGLWKSTATPALTQLQALLTTAVNNNFQTYAKTTWPGNLMVGSTMGATVENPVGFSLPIADDGAGNTFTPDTDGAEKYDSNGAIANINDPPNQNLVTTDKYYAGKFALEKEKFSNKAGIYVKVTVTSHAGSADTAAIQLYGPGDPTKIGVAGYGPNGGVALGTAPATTVSFVPYTADASSKVLTGLYDQRENAGINLVQLNMGALNTALSDINSNTGKTATNATSDIVDTSNKVIAPTNWNGVVYVDVQAPSGNKTSVGLANGQVTSGNSLIPTVNNAGPDGLTAVTGLTIATNAPAYIEGNFNADGKSSGGSWGKTDATTPDDGNTGAPSTTSSAETPVAIVSDAVTILSPKYFGTGVVPTAASPNNAASSNANVSFNTPKPSSTADTEVASTFITGLVQTTDTASSGGAHNLPRFLENWGNTVAIRGSLMVFYHSKIATGPWSTDNYGAPTRVWGYDQILLYKKLQGFPNFPTLRRVGFQDMSGVEYTAAKAAALAN